MEEGPSPFPITLGPIDDPKLLFNLSPTDGVTQECKDSTQHRLLTGAMAFILYCDHMVPLESICDIYLNLTEKAITTPETNIWLAWAAVTLGNRLHVGLLEIPAEITFIHPLESRENWIAKGPKYELGDKIINLGAGSPTGLVHGFVNQANNSLLVLVWFNETDKYRQLSLDQIKPDRGIHHAEPDWAATGGHTCLSGCTLLEAPTGGIQLREIRPGTLLINTKGNTARVTNVYFSTENSEMVQILERCHASITHPILDTKRGGWA